ncbi:1-phosphofructokinase [Granulicatella seriolae]|uniref:Tagatose-6-phosphate kinase n=1 Tax=Granulicatella seriolae TaxID=2967226 RepID=A0ABT1WQA0_9LACT|nr:1-phosphofructokinase [Granulicatella seriolae]
MIYTITFNPAVDLVIKVPDFQVGDLNRSVGEDYVAGGKGINMSVVLHRLGQTNIATGFLAGFSGYYIKQELKREGIEPHFIEVEGTTRINVKLKSKEETEINAAGPHVSPEKFQELVSYFQDKLQEGDVVFLAGNAAPGMDSSAYATIAQLCQKKKAYFVLDATKDLLTLCLQYQPFIIKPNHHELGEIFGVTIQNEDEIITYARKLQEQGARNVLVSRGGDGALLVTEDGQILSSNVPKGKLINSVGAGDSMLAGFMAKYLETKDYAQSLQQGAATGSATAFSVGIATDALIQELIPQIRIEKKER